VPDVDNSKSSPSRADPSKPGQGAQSESGQEGDEPEGINANSANGEASDGHQQSGAAGKGQNSGQDAANTGENSSLLGKFRDAMSRLMSGMRQQPGSSGAQQRTSSQNGRQSKNESSGARQNGKQGQQPGNGQQADAQDGEPGEDGQNAQNSQAKSTGQTGDQPTTKQPGSGIGRQDGSKDVKLAEQLAAMGKISEIIGKRSANVTGEITVEVQNSNAQIRTPYAQTDARHTQAGGEIDRDEVPVALQAYVQQYFEQVRKQPKEAPHGDARPRRADPPKPPGS
jgi:hypothetical protein